MACNLTQSKLAIGSGGLQGKGYLEGTMTKLNYVPEESTDFIFCAIAEETRLYRHCKYHRTISLVASPDHHPRRAAKVLFFEALYVRRSRHHFRACARQYGHDHGIAAYYRYSTAIYQRGRVEPDGFLPADRGPVKV